MRRWPLYLGGALALLVGVAIGLAFVRIDVAQLASVAEASLSRATGYPVELGRVELRLLPVPAVWAKGLRIGEGRDGAPLLRADAVSFELSLRALLAGRGEVRSLVIEHPTLALERGRDGSFVLPEPPVERRDGADESLTDSWIRAVTAFEIRDGVLKIDSWQLEQVALSGAVRTAGGTSVDVELSVPGLGCEGRIELSDPTSAGPRWSAAIELRNLDLRRLAEIASPESAIWGNGEGSLEASGDGLLVRRAAIDLSLRELDLQSVPLNARGDVELSARLGERWRADLENADVRFGDLIHKPRGLAAVASGELPREWPVDVVEGLRLDIAGRELRGDVRWSDSPTFRLSGELDLARVEVDWSALPAPPAGEISFEELVYAPPQQLRAVARTDGVVVQLADGHTVTLEGPFSLDGQRITSPGLGVDYLGERMTVAGTFDPRGERLDVRVEAQGVQIERLTEAWFEKTPVLGRLYARFELHGAPRLDALTGGGEFDLPSGAFSNFSVSDFLVARHTDSSKPPFRRLAGEFRLADQNLEFSALTLDQDEVDLWLEGVVSLIDGEVDLIGDASLLIDRETVSQPVHVTGRLGDRLDAALGARDPVEQEQQRESDLRMLEGMLAAMERRGIPDDPEGAAEFERMRTRLVRQIESKRAAQLADSDERRY